MIRIAVLTGIIFIVGGCVRKSNDTEKADFYFEKGLSYTFERNDSLALMYYDSAIMHYQDAAYFTNRGAAKLELKDTLGAMEDLLYAQKLDSSNYSSLSNIGFIYLEKQDYTKALENYIKSSTIEPDQDGIHLSIGYCYYMLEDYQEALDALMKYLGSDYPVNFNYAIELATDCFGKLGNKEDIEWWQEQLERFKSVDGSGMLDF